MLVGVVTLHLAVQVHEVTDTPYLFEPFLALMMPDDEDFRLSHQQPLLKTYIVFIRSIILEFKKDVIIGGFIFDLLEAVVLLFDSVHQVLQFFLWDIKFL